MSSKYIMYVDTEVDYADEDYPPEFYSLHGNGVSIELSEEEADSILHGPGCCSINQYLIRHLNIYRHVFTGLLPTLPDGIAQRIRR